MAKPEQYVGISGGVRADQQAEVLGYAHEAGVAQLGAFVMWGVQASVKTQIDEIPTRYGEGWHAVGDNIAGSSFLDRTNLTRPFIHIYGGDEDRELQMRTIMATVARTGEFQRGLQLNRLDWNLPEYDGFMAELRQNVPDMPIVLQCQDRIMGVLSPQEIVERLKTLKPEYVLFDVSHGRGLQMEPEFVRAYVDAIYQAQLDVGVVVAGGLSAETLDTTVAPLYEEYPDLSCDAEGAMRTDDTKDETELDLSKVRDYIHSWACMVGGIRKSNQ